jgi:hypothetical protein
MLATCPTDIIPLWFDHSAIYSKELFIIQFSSASYCFAYLTFRYSPQYPKLLSFHECSRPSFPHIMQASCLNEEAVLLYTRRKQLNIKNLSPELSLIFFVSCTAHEVF